MPLLENVTHQAVALVHTEVPSAGHDARSILAAVLQHRQGVIERLINRTVPDDADNAAHAASHEFVGFSATYFRPVST